MMRLDDATARRKRPRTSGELLVRDALPADVARSSVELGRVRGRVDDRSDAAPDSQTDLLRVAAELEKTHSILLSEIVAVYCALGRNRRGCVTKSEIVALASGRRFCSMMNAGPALERALRCVAAFVAPPSRSGRASYRSNTDSDGRSDSDSGGESYTPSSGHRSLSPGSLQSGSGSCSDTCSRDGSSAEGAYRCLGGSSAAAPPSTSSAAAVSDGGASASSSESLSRGCSGGSSSSSDDDDAMGAPPPRAPVAPPPVRAAADGKRRAEEARPAHEARERYSEGDDDDPRESGLFSSLCALDEIRAAAAAAGGASAGRPPPPPLRPPLVFERAAAEHPCEHQLRAVLSETVLEVSFELFCGIILQAARHLTAPPLPRDATASA